MNNGSHDPKAERRARVAHAPEPEEGSTLLRSLRVLRRRGWILAIALGVTTGLAAIAAVSQPRRYRSEATIEVGPDRPLVSPDTIGDPLEGSSLLWENHFRTQEALLRRPGLLAMALEALPAEEVAEFRAAPDPARRLSEDLEIDSVPSTFLIRITLDHPTPERGPKIVNKIVELFIEDANRRLKELKTGVLEILKNEALPAMRQKIDESEKRLWEFHRRQGFGDLEEQYAGLQEAKRRFGARLSEVRLRRIALKNRPDASAEGGDRTADRESAVAMDALIARRTELEVELARQTVLLKEQHPTVVGLKRQVDVVQNLIQVAVKARMNARDRELAAADLEEKSLMEEEERLDQAMSEAQVKLAQYRELQGDVRAARELYDSYLKKQGEVKATSGAGLTSVRIVDLAHGPKVHQQRPGLYLALGLVFGLLFGIVAILIAEQVDDRISSPRHAESALSLDVLTAIPAMEPAGEKEQPLVPADDPVASPLEAFRRLRTEVAMRLQDVPGPKVVAVLSALDSEGRSTVAVNLARVFALEGHRVLLVDADLRRPRLKALLADCENPGLEEYLLGESPLTGSIQETRLPGVHLLGARSGVTGAAEAPGSPRFRALWPSVRAEFDLIVVDTSPVNAASEVPVVARSADASLLVVEEGRSGARQALAAIRRLENHQVRVLGLVVNRSGSRGSRRPGSSKPEAARAKAGSGNRPLVGIK